GGLRFYFDRDRKRVIGMGYLTWYEWTGSDWQSHSIVGTSSSLQDVVYDPDAHLAVTVTQSQQIEYFDANTSTWSQASTIGTRPPQQFHAIAYDEAHHKLVGLFGTGSAEDTWIWDRATSMWTD